MTKIIIDIDERQQIAVVFHNGVVLVPNRTTDADKNAIESLRSLVGERIEELLTAEIFALVDHYESLKEIAAALRGVSEIKVVFIDEI